MRHKLRNSTEVRYFLHESTRYHLSPLVSFILWYRLERDGYIFWRIS